MVERETENKSQHREQNDTRPGFHACFRKARAGMLTRNSLIPPPESCPAPSRDSC
jgi:hypothetical protein